MSKTMEENDVMGVVQTIARYLVERVDKEVGPSGSARTRVPDWPRLSREYGTTIDHGRYTVTALSGPFFISATRDGATRHGSAGQWLVGFEEPAKADEKRVPVNLDEDERNFADLFDRFRKKYPDLR